jgi:hypothetical protein
MNRGWLTILIATVWFVNGFVCKVLDLVPRHREIVGRILGDSYARSLTPIIGGLEILMAIWVVTRIRSRLCAVVQIVVVMTMNILEFFLTPDLLLFGRLNILIAIGFVAVIYYNEFVPGRKPS